MPGAAAAGFVVMFRRRARTGPGPQMLGGEHEPSPVVPIDDASFLELTAGTYTVVDFWAPWCGPCRAFAPLFHAAARQHPGGVRFGSCNVDENPRTTALAGGQEEPSAAAGGTCRQGGGRDGPTA